MEHHQAYIICMMGVPEGEKGKNGAENSFKEIMASNLPGLRKEMDI